MAMFMNGEKPFHHPVTGQYVGPFQWYEGFAHVGNEVSADSIEILEDAEPVVDDSVVDDDEINDDNDSDDADVTSDDEEKARKRAERKARREAAKVAKEAEQAGE